MFLILQKNSEETNLTHFIILVVLVLIPCFGFSQEISIKRLDLNTEWDHFAAAVVGEGRVYLSHNQMTKRGRPVKDPSGGYIYNLYEGKQTKDGEIIDLTSVKLSREGDFNMSVATFTKDGKFVYFTTNNRVVGEDKMEGIDTYHLQIQRAEFVDGQWTNFTALPFCKIDASYGHPALSPDGNTLYFVAKIEDTKGKTDIYKVAINNHDTYGVPVRLSDQINSPRSEVYPFISDDNVLYFSSNRRGGVGGFDIYRFDLNTSDNEVLPEALPKPINTLGEEFGFFLMNDLKSGYVTSRRTRSKGRDDLYYFTGY